MFVREWWRVESPWSGLHDLLKKLMRDNKVAQQLIVVLISMVHAAAQPVPPSWVAVCRAWACSAADSSRCGSWWLRWFHSSKPEWHGSVRKACESGGSGVCAGGECGGGLQNQSAVDKMIAQICSAVPFTVIHTRTTAWWWTWKRSQTIHSVTDTVATMIWRTSSSQRKQYPYRTFTHPLAEEEQC